MNSKKILYKALMNLGYKGLFKIVDSFDVCDIVALVRLDNYKETKFATKEDVKEVDFEQVPEGCKIHFLKFSNPRDTRNFIYFTKLKKKL